MSESKSEGGSGTQPQASGADEATQQPSSSAVDDRSDESAGGAVLHPTATLPRVGEGELLSAVLDADEQREEEAEAEAERERSDTEAAIALAIAMSKQQSHPSLAATPPSLSATSTSLRPASPVQLLPSWSLLRRCPMRWKLLRLSWR